MIEIRSYRSVFDLERRIYRIDRLRLNPGGVPVRGVVYWLALLTALALAGELPLLGAVLGLAPWYLRDLLLPGAGAWLLTVANVDGRPSHLAVAAMLRHAVGPRYLSSMRPCAAPGVRWRPGTLLLLPDGSEDGLRRLRYCGPGAVHVRARRQVIVLDRGAQLRCG
jgi:hypothetical protein